MSSSLAVPHDWQPGQPLLEGWYANPRDPSDPLLDARAAAGFLGREESFLRRREHKHELPCEQVISTRAGGLNLPRYVAAYRLSYLRRLRDADGTRREADLGDGRYKDGEVVRVNLVRAAALSGVPYPTLLREVRQFEDKRRANFLRDLNIEIKKMSPAAGRIEPWTVPEADAVRLGKISKRSLKQGKGKGFLFHSEIAVRLGLEGGGGYAELHQCLRHWQEIGLLRGELVFTKQSGKVTTRVRRRVLPVERLRWRWSFDAERAARLWSAECSVKAGAARFRQLVPAGGERPVVEVKAEMARVGFVGLRLDGARRVARVKARLSNGAGSPWLYVRDPQNARRPAKEVLEGILRDGPVLPKDAAERLRAAGWSPHAGAVKKAMRQLKVKAVDRWGRPVRHHAKHLELLHGPYEPPAWRPGDRLTCKVRGEVLVGGTHCGKIPWPYARREDPKHQLIVCGDLERALRQEAPGLVAHWWGVSLSTVEQWVVALGLPRARGGRNTYWCLPGQKPPPVEAGSACPSAPSDTSPPAAVEDDAGYITGKQACRMTGMTPTEVTRLCREGGPVRFKRHGRRLKVNAVDLARYLDERDGVGE
jgi:hypothetical protein